MRRVIPLQLFLSLCCAIVVERLVAVEWWHPYCDVPADGPGFWATGFPLPYAEADGAVSFSYVLLVPVFLLDLAIIMVPSFAMIRIMWWLANRPGRVLIAVALVASAGLLCFEASPDAFPILRMRFGPYDSLTSYRPAFAVDFSRHRLCEA